MLNQKAIDTLVNGFDTRLPEEVKTELEKRLVDFGKELDGIGNNRSTSQLLNTRQQLDTSRVDNARDAEMFTSISEMINGGTRDFGGFGTLLDNLYAKNKKYFTTNESFT